MVMIQPLRVRVIMMIMKKGLGRGHWGLIRARLGHDDCRKQALLANVVLLVRLDDVVDQGAVLWQEHAGYLK